MVDLIYAFFETFGVIQTVTGGGPANSTTTLVYSVYHDGFYGLNFGLSAAQSVMLLIIMGCLTWLQYDRKKQTDRQ